MAVALSAAGAPSLCWALTGPEGEIRNFIAGWDAAYTRLDADELAKLETPDFQLVDRFGHWIESEGGGDSDHRLGVVAREFDVREFAVVANNRKLTPLSAGTLPLPFLRPESRK